MNREVKEPQGIQFHVGTSYLREHVIQVEARSADGSLWTARVRGHERSSGEGRLALPLSHTTIPALAECLCAEEEYGEGLLNLDHLLSSLKNADTHSGPGVVPFSADEMGVEWERGDSQVEATWFFNKVSILQDDREIVEEIDVQAKPPRTVPKALWASVRELFERDAHDLWQESLANGTFSEGFERLSVQSVTLLPQFCVVAPGSLMPPGARRFHDTLEGVAEAVQLHPRGADPAFSWPVILDTSVQLPDEDVKLTSSVRARRLEAVAARLRGCADAALSHLEGKAAFVLGPRDAALKENGIWRPFLASGRFAEQERKYQWWPVDQFISDFLDGDSPSCRALVGEFFGDEEVAIGVQTPLPFIGSHRGKELSAALGDVTMRLCESGMNAYRSQGYCDGEFESGVMGYLADGDFVISGDHLEFVQNPEMTVALRALVSAWSK